MGDETPRPWQRLRLDLARGEYHLELQRSAQFAQGVGVLLALIGAAFVLRLAQGMPLWGLGIGVMAFLALYLQLMEYRHHRVDLGAFVFANKDNPDQDAWEEHLIETYDDAISKMRKARLRSHWVVLAATLVLLAVSCLANTEC